MSRPKFILITCACLALAFACGAALGKALSPPTPTTVPAIDLSPQGSEGEPTDSSARSRRREPREQARPRQVTPARPPEEDGEGAQQVEPAPVVPGDDDNDDGSTDDGSDDGDD